MTPPTAPHEPAVRPDAGQLTDDERAALRAVLRSVRGAEHAVAALAGCAASTVLRAADGAALLSHNLAALQRLLNSRSR